ncbi:MAG TPA: ABC transporter permease [Bacteroidia bacterium]|jgi:phospholipid/cholesterol/gamma-HCH transport system permease protein|nr:ABC transporter permease [Bacteroidia bacterium]
MGFLFHIGRYFLLIRRAFSKPEKFSVYRNQFFFEVNNIGITSLGIVSIISVFMGGVVTIQAAFGFTSPWVPLYAVGFTTRESVILEFSPTIVSLILAGKVGSNIASEIGSMRISEQIDALEIMGVNSSAFLILPKILAGIFIFPFLVAISMFLGILGGYIMGVSTGACTSYQYIFGIQAYFMPWKLGYSFFKSAVFGYIITSVASYNGYYVKGGALEVGRGSTKAVVYASILILVTNFVITQIVFAH